MKSIRLVVLASILASAAAATARPLQDPQPQEQTQPAPPQEPAPELQAPSPVYPSGDPGQRQTDRYEQQQQRQREADQERRDMERRQQILDALGVDPRDSQGAGQRQTSRPYFAPVMMHDSEFDLRSVPLATWLDAKDTAELPWSVDIKDPALRLDQRLEVAYTARILAKHLNKLGNEHELFFIIGVTSPAGEWLVVPKVVQQAVKNKLPNDMELWFSDWVFAEPGDYVFWFVLYDQKTGKHNVARRRVAVTPIEKDPFPHAADALPRVELPRLSDREGGTIMGFYSGLLLPIQNKRKIQLEVIPVLSPPEQWVDQKDRLRIHNEKTVAAVNTLSQMKLADGSISITGLDVIRREVAFQQREVQRLDTKAFLQALQTDHTTVSAATLQGNKTGGAFFRNSLNQRLVEAEGVFRVFIVVNSPNRFERGSDLEPPKSDGDCRCRVYHLRFRHGVHEFDDIEKLLKTFRPKTFDLETARDLRKALAEIIKDLEELPAG